MSLLTIRLGVALTPLEEIKDAVLVMRDGIIESVGRREDVTLPAKCKEIDACDYIGIPGLVDVHVHGAAGHDFMEAAPDALNAITAKLAAHGTTAVLATTVTAPTDATCRAIEGIARYIKGTANTSPSAAQAQVMGIHFEGPFISPARRGVHPRDSIALPSLPTLNRFLEAADGCARILTLAPELPGALELVAAARRHKLIVSMGHTDASYEQACAGIEAGITHAAHVFNAMRPFSHRQTGVLGAVLTDERVTAEIIADGVHVDPPAIRVLLAAKGMKNVVLISDGTAATGMPDGTYYLGTLQFTVSGGICRNAEGHLAGSTLTLDRALRQMVSLNVPLRSAVAMATINPARRIGLQERKGVLAASADADLVLLRGDLSLAGVMTRGNLRMVEG